MSEFVCLFKYKHLLSCRRAVRAEAFTAKLKISRGSSKRHPTKMRDAQETT